MEHIRFDWSLEELQALYDQPLMKLVAQSHALHGCYHRIGEVQLCRLLSIKTGGCPEDCKYCPQSSRYQTNVSPQPLVSYETTLAFAKQAAERGITRICLGAAWREVRDNKQFAEILRMVKGVKALGLEVCCTLGMLQPHQAKQLKDAGLYAYNHNLDSSERFYKTIITTRTYQDRLRTLEIVRKAGISVCCGGILGMGETIQDRLELLLMLCRHNPHPESVPINRLIIIPGTPLENRETLSLWELLRIIAIARICMPLANVRLSAGRSGLSYEGQALCFFAGANSIHTGEKLLTQVNNSEESDEEMFALLGLERRPAFQENA